MLTNVNTASLLPSDLSTSPTHRPFGSSREVDRKKKKLGSYKALCVGKENIPPPLLKHRYRNGRRGSPVKAGHRRVGQTFARVPDYAASDASTSTSDDDLADVFM